MDINKYRKYILITIIAAIISISAAVTIFWNTLISISEKKSAGIGLFLLYFLSLILLGYTIRLILKGFKAKTIDDQITKKVAEARLQIIKEFEKKEEVVEVSDEKELINEKIKNILPKGTFKTINAYLEKMLKNLANELEFVQGIVYLRVNKTKKYKYSSGFALTNSDNIPEFKEGENLTGQAAASKDLVIINDIPEVYFNVESGLGSAKPKQIVIIPVLVKNNVNAIIELASFKSLSSINKEIISNLMTEVGSKIEQITKA